MYESLSSARSDYVELVDDLILEKCFDGLEACIQEAAAQDKIAFMKEHMNFMLEPSA